MKHKKNNKRRKSKRIFAAVLLICIILIPFGNSSLRVNTYKFKSEKVTADLNGFLIAQVSDYHNTYSNSLKDRVLGELEDEKPDIIVITGDLVDCRKTKVERSLEFAKELTAIAPVYYIEGNHEYNLSLSDKEDYTKLTDGLKAMGVNLLMNESVVIKKGSSSFTLCGIRDLYSEAANSAELKEAAQKLCSGVEKDEGINILLSHHPEELDVYSEYGFDLVFSGHAHGGQVRIFGMGLYAPDQGILPKYTSGEYKSASTTLIVSRGIGNSIAPLRVFDSPQLVFCELVSK